MVGARSASVPHVDRRAALTVPLASTKTLQGPMHVCNALRIAIERESTLKVVVVRQDFMGPMGTARFVQTTITAQAAVNFCRALKAEFQTMGASC